MLQRTPKKKPARAELSEEKALLAAFANEVDLIGEYIRSGGIGRFAGDQRENARKVAFGLQALEDLADQELKKMKAQKAPWDEMPATGILEAIDIIDALVNKRDHPFWEYVGGSRITPRRSNARIQQLRYDLIVGAVIAYERVAARKRPGSQAIRAVIELCVYKGPDEIPFVSAILNAKNSTERARARYLAFEQVRDWRQSPGPDAEHMAFMILDRASSRSEAKPTDRVLLATIGPLWGLWPVARLPNGDAF